MKENYTRRYAKDFHFGKYLFQLFAVYCISIPFLWFFYRLEVKGKENIPQDRRTKFIIAPNHISYFDPFIAAIAVRRRIAFMAKKELFDGPKLGKTIDYLGAFSVNREKLEVSTIKTVKEIFKTKKWFLGIFPQGGIRKNKTIEKINKGFAVIAKAAKVDVLPISITGVEQYNWVPFKGKIIVEVGELVSYKQEVDDIINEWGQKVAKMASYEHISPSEEQKESEKVAVIN